MAFFDLLQRDSFFDHMRMCEDLVATWDIFSTSEGECRSMSPPTSVLSRVGDDLLHALPDDHNAWHMRHDQQFIDRLKSRIYCHACCGVLPINYAMAAAILGRKDLHHLYFDGSWLDADRGLAWFLLHGIVEHRLWHYMTADFLDLLLKKAITFGQGNLISPLEYLLLIERPDLATSLPNRAGQKELDAALLNWVMSNAVVTYRLSWIPALFTKEGSTSVLGSAIQLQDDSLPREIVGLVRPTERSYTPAEVQFDLLLRDRLAALPPLRDLQSRIGYGGIVTLSEILIYGKFQALSSGSVLIIDRAACFIVPQSAPNASLIIIESESDAPTDATLSIVTLSVAQTFNATPVALDGGCSVVPLRLLPHGPGGSRILVLLGRPLGSAAPSRLGLVVRNIWIV